MEFTNVIQNRRSIRKFTDELISDEILKRILEAGRLAPTWANLQGTRYIVVKNPEKVKAIAEATGQKWALGVPMFIVATISPQHSGKNKNGLEYYMLDLGICFEHIILAITNEGLGGCWMGYFDEQAIKTILSVPNEERVIALTPLGFPNYSLREQIRIPLKEIAFREKFGNEW